MIKRNSWIIFHNFVQTCSSNIRTSTIHGGFEKEESNKSGGPIVDQQHSTKCILILIFIDPNLLLILKSDHNIITIYVGP